jgi:hypothetical protein
LAVGDDEGDVDEDLKNLDEATLQQTRQIAKATVRTLNNDFEHRCLNDAVRRLGATKAPDYAVPSYKECYHLPGVTGCAFLPFQIEAIYFSVSRMLDNQGGNFCMVADEMGLGKTYTALGTALYLKWLYAEWRNGNALPMLDGNTVEEMWPQEDGRPPVFEEDPEGGRLLARPMMVITQPIIQSEWLAAAKLALKGTNMELIELASSKRATWTAADINLGDNVPDRGNKLYLISYDTLRSRAPLKDASFGFVIYAESHSCKSWRS